MFVWTLSSFKEDADAELLGIGNQIASVAGHSVHCARRYMVLVSHVEPPLDLTLCSIFPSFLQ